MGKGKRKPKEPMPRTAFEHLAKQTGTYADEWTYVIKSSKKYAEGFRYWHPKQDLYAKR